MKNLPIVIAVLAFLLPIGFVVVNGMDSDSKPVNGKLLYFYSPG